MLWISYSDQQSSFLWFKDGLFWFWAESFLHILSWKCSKNPFWWAVLYVLCFFYTLIRIDCCKYLVNKFSRDLVESRLFSIHHAFSGKTNVLWKIYLKKSIKILNFRLLRLQPFLSKCHCWSYLQLWTLSKFPGQQI